MVPIGPAHSSYNGLILLVFITVSATLGAAFVHRFGSRALRRSPAWDCGYPDPSPRTQYSASSFAQPLRRYSAMSCFARARKSTCPGPGTSGLAFRSPGSIWSGSGCTGQSALVGLVADRLNVLQYLTVRRYLTMMFGALVFLLSVVAVWR